MRMNKVFCVLGLFLMASCSSDRKMEKSVREYIVTHWVSHDKDRPDIRELEVLRTITAQDMVDNWYVQYNQDHMSADSAKAEMQRTALYFEDIAREDSSESAQAAAREWREKADRIQELEEMDQDDPVLYVVRVLYQIPNPAIFNHMLSFTRFFVLDGDCRVIEAIDEEAYKVLESGDKFTVLNNYDGLIMAADRAEAAP